MTDFSNTLSSEFDILLLRGDKMFKSMVTNLMVEDVKETIDFYEDVLGFTLITSVPNKKDGFQFAIMSKDEFNLMVQERTNFIEEYPSLGIEKVQPSVSLYIQVDNLEELYLELKSKHKLLLDMHTTFYGLKEFAIVDNSGYVLTFTEFIAN